MSATSARRTQRTDLTRASAVASAALWARRRRADVPGVRLRVVRGRVARDLWAARVGACLAKRWNVSLPSAQGWTSILVPGRPRWDSAASHVRRVPDPRHWAQDMAQFSAALGNARGWGCLTGGSWLLPPIPGARGVFCYRRGAG
jgi:hypothetical protein